MKQTTFYAFQWDGKRDHVDLVPEWFKTFFKVRIADYQALYDRNHVIYGQIDFPLIQDGKHKGRGTVDPGDFVLSQIDTNGYYHMLTSVSEEVFKRDYQEV
jgi:hypothetical protein